MQSCSNQTVKLTDDDSEMIYMMIGEWADTEEEMETLFSDFIFARDGRRVSCHLHDMIVGLGFSKRIMKWATQ